jgi:tetratricopeptide (TPR) repeat protein
VLNKHKFKLIFLVVSLLLYGSTLKNGYALDDEFVTGQNNITATGFKAIPKVFKVWHVTDESGNNYEYRPIVKVSFALEHGFWGENLVLSHLVNVLLYALALIVLFIFLKHVFHDYNEFVVFCIVLVFAFIPVHSEVVASLKNRDVLLSFIFSFYGAARILRFYETKERLSLAIALLMFALAFLSKFDVVPLIVIIPLIIYQKYKINVKAIVLIVFTFAMGYFLYKVAKGSMLDRVTVESHRTFLYFENPLYFGYQFGDRFSAGFNSLGFYVLMLLFPVNMVCYYGYNTVPVFSFTSMYALVGLIAGVWMIYVFFKRFKKPDMLWYGIMFFGLSISMYLNFLVPAAGIVADRFAFFASVGFSVVAVYFLFFFKNPLSKKISGIKSLKFHHKAIPAVVFFIFTLVIINRNKDWNNKSLLFETDLKKRPESVKLALLSSSQLIISLSDPNNAAAISQDAKVKKIREAENNLRNAIKVDSSCGGCYNNLSFMYLTYERRPQDALPYLLLGYRRDSTRKEMVCNIGISYYRMGELGKAEKYLLKAIILDKKKDFTVPYEVLQDLYSKTNPEKAVALLQQKLEESPDSEYFNVLLGKTYFDMRDTLNSLKYYKEALRVNPNNQQVNDFVARLEVKYQKSRW